MPRGGRVVLVGAGPGAPDLITLRGLRALSQADVVVYDRLVDPGLLGYARPGAELVYAGKERGRHAMTQEEINEYITRRALEGAVVVRLKGGDPLTYGRGEEECLHAIRSGVPCEVVPGVPSFLGAAAEYLIPLAGRGFASVVTLATGTLAGGSPLPRRRLDAIHASSDAAVYLMASRLVPAILESAAHVRGPGEAVAIVERATMPGSRVVLGTAGELASNPPAVEPPALVFVGGGARWRLENLGASARYY